MCRWFESNRGSQEELSFSVPLFSWLEKTAKSQQFPCWTRKAALGNSPVDCCNRRGFAAAKRVQQGEPKRELGSPGSLFQTPCQGPIRVSDRRLIGCRTCGLMKGVGLYTPGGIFYPFWLYNGYTFFVLHRCEKRLNHQK